MYVLKKKKQGQKKCFLSNENCPFTALKVEVFRNDLRPFLIRSPSVDIPSSSAVAVAQTPLHCSGMPLSS